MLTYALEASGASVLAVPSSVEALKAIGEDVPDVVVSDIAMPVASGYDLVRQIRALSVARGGEVLCIALTGYAATLDRERATHEGFDQHVTKPVDLTAFVTLLATCARERGLPARVRASSAS